MYEAFSESAAACTSKTIVAHTEHVLAGFQALPLMQSDPGGRGKVWPSGRRPRLSGSVLCATGKAAAKAIYEISPEGPAVGTERKSNEQVWHDGGMK